MAETKEEVSGEDTRYQLRDTDHNPCGAVLRTQDTRGQEAIFRCWLTPWHRRGHHRAIVGPGIVLRWPGNGREAGTRFPDSINFAGRR